MGPSSIILSSEHKPLCSSMKGTLIKSNLPALQNTAMQCFLHSVTYQVHLPKCNIDLHFTPVNLED